MYMLRLPHTEFCEESCLWTSSKFKFDFVKLEGILEGMFEFEGILSEKPPRELGSFVLLGKLQDVLPWGGAYRFWNVQNGDHIVPCGACAPEHSGVRRIWCKRGRRFRCERGSKLLAFLWASRSFIQAMACLRKIWRKLPEWFCIVSCKHLWLGVRTKRVAWGPRAGFGFKEGEVVSLGITK